MACSASVQALLIASRFERPGRVIRDLSGPQLDEQPSLSSPNRDPLFPVVLGNAVEALDFFERHSLRMLEELRDLGGLGPSGVRARAVFPQERQVLLADQGDHREAMAEHEDALSTRGHFVREILEVHAKMACRYAQFVHLPSLAQGSDILPGKKIIFFSGVRDTSGPARRVSGAGEPRGPRPPSLLRFF